MPSIILAEATPDALGDISRYAPEACARDIMDACAALHIHRAVVIGTSFGGLLAMGSGGCAARAGPAVVLNDIGPDIGAEGADFVRDFVGQRSGAGQSGRLCRVLRASLPPIVAGTPTPPGAAWRN